MWDKILDGWKQLIHDYMKDISDSAFAMIKIYLINGSDFKNQEFIGQLYDWVFWFSGALGGLFFLFALTKMLVAGMGRFNKRSWQEVTVKLGIGSACASLSPFIMQHVLLAINNAWVEFIVSKGIDVDSLSKLVMWPTTSGVTLLTFGLIFAVMMLCLAFQHIIRFAELMVIFVLGPIAGISMVNEEYNFWPVWWREACAVIFQQSIQITILWIVFNLIGDVKNLTDLILACGGMFVVLKGPSSVRKYIYSSGTARMAVGTTGNVGRTVLMKYAASKFIR